MAISPAGSVYTVTAPCCRVELPVGAYPLNCCRWFDHCATAQGDCISRPYKSNATLFTCIICPSRDTISPSRSSTFNVEISTSLIVSNSLICFVMTLLSFSRVFRDSVSRLNERANMLNSSIVEADSSVSPLSATRAVTRACSRRMGRIKNVRATRA